MNLIHFSIDDVIYIFKELTFNKPKSIFDLPILTFFKNLHNKYGIVISFYCFYKKGNFSLTDCTRHYKNEFEENSSWMRWGFHGFTGIENYSIQDSTVSLKQYLLVMNNLQEIVGNNSLDFFPRIHKFQANSSFKQKMVYSQYPLIGLLTADDDRISYDLNQSEITILNSKNLYKGTENLFYLRTTQRYDSLVKLYKIFKYKGTCIFFTHEYLFYPSTLKHRIKSLTIKKFIELTCRFYSNKKYSFNFPMEIIN